MAATADMPRALLEMQRNGASDMKYPLRDMQCTEPIGYCEVCHNEVYEFDEVDDIGFGLVHKECLDLKNK